MKHSTKYLYDIEPSVLVNMSYMEALQFKLQACKDLTLKLLEPHYSKRDDERIIAIGKAEKFNRKLLEEINDK